MKVSRINRFFNIAFGAIAMLAVALLSAYIAMRVAIHGREVEVPTLAGLSLTDAAQKAKSLGLRLNVENRFYAAAVPAGNVIAQSPAPGSTVRRESLVRITESLGGQQVSIPNLIGQTERPATITIRRLGLELGAVAHIPSPGPPGVVLAQTPAATSAASGVDSPRISLLISEPMPEPAAKVKLIADTDPTAPTTPPATPIAPASPAAAPSDNSTAGSLMPSLIGLNFGEALARAKAAGLHIVSIEEARTPIAASTDATPTTPTPASTPETVVSQTPPAGYHVLPGDPVKITLGHQ
jgi:eukaryotic-like serine/threonine-protein kinase